MVHFKALFVLVLGGIEVIQPAAAGVLAGLTARNDLVFNYFLSRQTSSGPQVPPQCASTCNPVAPTIAAGVSDITYINNKSYTVNFRIAPLLYAAQLLSKPHLSIV